jgi:hypothetical protein
MVMVQSIVCMGPYIFYALADGGMTGELEG